jgi:hypothetical protein
MQMLQQCLAEYVLQCGKFEAFRSYALLVSLVESLHLMLTLLVEVDQSTDPDEGVSLAAMTDGRSGFMKDFRHKLLNANLPMQTQELMVSVVMLFERAGLAIAQR